MSAPTTVHGSIPSARPPSEARALSWSSFATIYLPAMLLALGTGIALPAIPVLARSFDVPFGVASGVVTAFLIGGLAGSLPTGWLVDRVGRRPIMIAGPILTAVMALLTAMAQSFPELLFYRFVDGWAAQMWLLARLAGISHNAGAGQRGRQVSWMYGMDNVGRLSGPLVGGFIAAAFGPRSAFLAYAVLALLALVPTLRLQEDAPPRRASVGDGRAPHLGISFWNIVIPRLAFFGIAFFSAIARGPIFADMLHLYAAFAYDLDAQTIGILATAASVTTLPIGFIAGWLMDRFGRKVTMVPGFSAVTITMLMLAGTAFLHLPFSWYVVVFLATVAAQGLTGGSIQTVGTDVAPPEARGLFLGLWRFTGQVGTSISPIVFAILADHTGYGSSFIFVATAGLITALLLVTLIPETSKTRVA
ncbi:MAG TPA: MFS transporter [Chloroflexota bacterium]|nr:MFS transporter [Chloroflexota bacterium]